MLAWRASTVVFCHRPLRHHRISGLGLTGRNHDTYVHAMDLEQWFTAIPPVTRAWLVASAATSLLVVSAAQWRLQAAEVVSCVALTPSSLLVGLPSSPLISSRCLLILSHSYTATSSVDATGMSSRRSPPAVLQLDVGRHQRPAMALPHDVLLFRQGVAGPLLPSILCVSVPSGCCEEPEEPGGWRNGDGHSQNGRCQSQWCSSMSTETLYETRSPSHSTCFALPVAVLYHIWFSAHMSACSSS